MVHLRKRAPLADALVVLSGVAADRNGACHLYTQLLAGKVDGGKDGKVRIPLAAAADRKTDS